MLRSFVATSATVLPSPCCYRVCVSFTVDRGRSHSLLSLLCHALDFVLAVVATTATRMLMLLSLHDLGKVEPRFLSLLSLLLWLTCVPVLDHSLHCLKSVHVFVRNAATRNLNVPSTSATLATIVRDHNICTVNDPCAGGELGFFDSFVGARKPGSKIFY